MSKPPEPGSRRDLASLVYRHSHNGDAPEQNGHSAGSALRQAVRTSPITYPPAAPESPATQAYVTPPSQYGSGGKDPGQYGTPGNPSAPPAARHDPRNAAAQIEEARLRLDRDLVRSLAAEVSKRLSEARRDRDTQAADATNTGVTISYTADELEAVGAQIAEDLVHEHIASTIDIGGGVAPSAAEERALIQAVCDTLFKLGPVQPLVDEANVENILFTGGKTTVMYGDGRSEQRPPVFHSDEEAVQWVSFLAAHYPGGGRTFSQASPALRLNLKGNIRLSALGWTTEGISIAIRKHLHKDITIDRLVDMDVMPETLCMLLVAGCRAGLSIIASGPMGAGKTTFIRALANALPVETRIGTAELVRELYLHELPGRDPYVVSAEVITGGGERNEFTDQPKGQFNLHMILQEFVSQQLDRVIVGEVAGREILAMFKAMQMAKGSMTTVHATTARGAIDRLTTLAMEEPGVDEVYAIRQVAAHVNLIVQMNTHWARDEDGQMRSHRHISEVAWVEPGENSRPAVSLIYSRPHPLREGRWGTLPPRMRDLVVQFGFPSERLPVFDIAEDL